MEKDYVCLWHGVHAGVQWVHSRGVLAAMGLDLNEIHVNWYKVGMCFVRISYEFVKIHAPGRYTTLPGLAAFNFGHHLAVVGPFGQEFRRMMWNESRGCVLPPHLPHMQPKLQLFHQKAKSLGKFASIRMLHSNDRLTPVQERVHCGASKPPPYTCQVGEQPKCRPQGRSIALPLPPHCTPALCQRLHTPFLQV